MFNTKHHPSSSSSSSSSFSTLHHMLLLLLWLLLLLHSSHTLNVEQLCEIRCNIGRGGVLCKCNAFHFAGKRSEGASRYFDHLAATFRERKYKNPNGGVTISASGSVRPFGDAEEKEGSGDVRMGGREDRGGVMAKGLFGERGEGRATVENLTSLLKNVLSSQRLVSRSKNKKDAAQAWRESSFPFTADDVEY